MGNILSFFFTNPKTIHHDLPEHIVLEEILLRLPLKSLVRFKCVSKKWHNHISSDSFFLSAYHCRHAERSRSSIVLAKDIETDRNTKLFLLFGAQPIPMESDTSSLLSKKLALKEFDRVRIAGSCNGLVLVTDIPTVRSSITLALWNPATMEIRNLPAPMDLIKGIYEDFSEYTHTLGLGFDDENKEHKVVRVVEAGRERYPNGTLKRWLTFLVLTTTSGVDSWRETKSPLLEYQLWYSKTPVYLAGAIYFLGYKTGNEEPKDWRRARVLSFDFRAEEGRELISLPENPPGWVRNFTLAAWKGDSLAVLADNGSRIGPFDFFVLRDNNNNNNNKCWVKLFGVDSPMCLLCKVVGVWRDRFIVQRRRQDELAFFDPVGKRIDRRIRIKCDWLSFSLHDYVPTPVSVYPKTFQLL